MMHCDSAPVAREQLQCLTGLRFVAACGVLFLHSGSGFSHSAQFPPVIATFLKHGYLGVSVFFVLSGFILTYTYSARLYTPQAVAKYLLARFARIYPIYILALLLTLPLLRVGPDARSAASVLLLVQSWTPAKSEHGYTWVMQAWTLSVEFFFYLLLPFVIPFVVRVPKWALLPIVTALAVVIVVLGAPTIAPGASRATYGSIVDWFLPSLRMPEFLLGVGTAGIVMRRPEILRQITARTFFLPLNISAIFLILALADDEAIHVLSLMAPLIAVFICQLIAAPSSVQRLLGGRWLVLLGGASYAIYLLQMPMHGYVWGVTGSVMVARLAYFPVLICVSIFAYRMLEEPARTWLTYLFSRRRNARFTY
jgi:peptidoglycan/LPS O-acetylase OafA/YrhL